MAKALKNRPILFPVGGLDGQPMIGELSFALQAEIKAITRWGDVRLPPGTHQRVKDAKEFSQLALKRGTYYRTDGLLASSLDECKKRIRSDGKTEFGMILVGCTRALIDGQREIIAAFCRRSWSGSLILDFLTLNPRFFDAQTGETKVRIGTAFFGALAVLAQKLNLRELWGEATLSSHGFYRRQKESAYEHLGAAHAKENSVQMPVEIEDRFVFSEMEIAALSLLLQATLEPPDSLA